MLSQLTHMEDPWLKARKGVPSGMGCNNIITKEVWHYIMAASKKYKQVRQREIPKGKNIAQGGNPEQYYSENPAWSFASSDQEMWSFSQKHIGNTIWTEIIPRLRALKVRRGVKFWLKIRNKTIRLL